MASLSPHLKIPVSDLSSQKPSLRQRLFSNGRKVSRQGKEPGDITPPNLHHPVENSASTSSEHILILIFLIYFLPHRQPNNSGTLTTESPNSVTNGQASVLQAPNPPTPLSVAASAVPAAVLRAKADESDRERGSLNTTLTANNRRVPFYRRKASNKSSASEVALSPSASPSLIKSRRNSSRSRPSFLSRVVHRVVPCVSPDPEIVHNDIDDDASEPRRSFALKEMTTVRPTDYEMDTSSPGTQDEVANGAHDSSVSPPVTIQIQPPPSPSDSEVIVPPPPSAHLLPEDETDGVTSGAVQPPGSTGDQVVRTNTHDSEDSDGTSYTDDEGEDRHMLDEQDEEDRLIRNGGSGIPIGTVRPLILSNYCILTLGSTPQDGLPKPLLPPISPEHVGRKCLVLDLDETLVHSSFKVCYKRTFGWILLLKFSRQYNKPILSSLLKLSTTGIIFMFSSDLGSTTS